MAPPIGSTSILEKAKAYVEELFDQKISENFSYHNFDHTMDVYESCKLLAKKSKLSKEEKEVLFLSALFHDTGFSVERDNHEAHSQDIAKDYLERGSYDAGKLDKVLKCINATRIEAIPQNEIERIIKDADLSGLASDAYQDIAEQIRLELNYFQKDKVTKGKWLKTNYEFFKNHHYYSKAGKEMYGEKKRENEKFLEEMLEVRKEKKMPKTLTIANSKSAQTQFKTALRNHIDLSAIADNKANIMLSVNALIITVALPILADTIQSIPLFLYPTLSLLVVSVTSMIFATLATRPIRMAGNTSFEDVKSKRSNLFFFGNFYKMKFTEYEEGIKEVVAQDEVLDNAITRDLFYLGKALGAKYSNLRWCYNIFMFGVIVTVVLFGVMLIIQNS